MEDKAREQDAATHPPKAEISVSVLSDLWHAMSGAEDIVLRAAHAAARAVGHDGAVEMSIALASAETLHKLNLQYRLQNKPTNVLSFPNGMMLAGEPDKIFLGDVAIAYEATMAEAAVEGKDPRDHLAHLAVHGVLHLFGYDHETDEEAERMEALERAVLASIGVGDPYAAVTAGNAFEAA